MMWWWGGNHMGAGGWIGMGFMIVFWIAVVVGIVYLVRYMIHPRADSWQERAPYYRDQRPPGPQAPAQEKPEAIRILEERYARGEIDQEEFLRKRADLTS